MTPKRKRRRLSGRKRWLFVGRLILFLIALGAAALFLFPTVLTFTDSFMSQSEIQMQYGSIFAVTGSGGYVTDNVELVFIPETVSFSQYITVLFKSPDYLYKFWNSMLITLPVVLFQLVIASLASYSFMRFRGKIRTVIFFSYIILMLMPYQVTLVPNYIVAEKFKLLDSYWSIILPGGVAPFSVFLLTKSMRRIPKSLIEAAKLDGASEWQIFTRICLPNCKSALYAVAILAFIDFWNVVEQVLVLISDETKYPLSIFLSRINQAETGLAFAIATIYMIPGLLQFLHGEEYLVEGIANAGSIKG